MTGISTPDEDSADSADPITVVTLTRARPRLLDRAIASVRVQDYPGRIEHLIVIDDDRETVSHLERRCGSTSRSLVWHLEPRPSGEVKHGYRGRASVYPHLARLLNRGVALARSPWLAFLDDDNEYEPHHLSSLMACARRFGSPAVHSARQMVWPDGSPYLEPLFPGASSVEEGARIFELMCRRGVWVRGTNVLQDRVDTRQTLYRNSTVLGSDDPIFLVDQNLWLIQREVLVAAPIPQEFSEEEIAQNTCPDDKMLETLVKNGVNIVSSKLPTVRYYLGGISNGDEQALDTAAAPKGTQAQP